MIHCHLEVQNERNLFIPNLLLVIFYHSDRNPKHQLEYDNSYLGFSLSSSSTLSQPQPLRLNAPYPKALHPHGHHMSMWVHLRILKVYSLPLLTRAWIGCWPSVLNVARAICRIEYNLWVTVSSVAIVTAPSLFPAVPQIALKSRYRAKPFPQRGQEFYFHKEQNS